VAYLCLEDESVAAYLCLEDDEVLVGNDGLNLLLENAVVVFRDRHAREQIRQDRLKLYTKDWLNAIVKSKDWIVCVSLSMRTSIV